ncbi:amidohydrolase family protein [Pseudonocardia sp. TRM90224]|uniref:amidohydrolase family protein n=1 Tax=Pseudonocardia sp. TRM90224 TaxID=2812678 RepID=UPI001E3DD9AF|nr:amidohydrolase family protein [Pseudonocardia sp. TRM90224]
MNTLVVDAHVRIGQHREAALSVEALLAAMDRTGVDRAVVAPSEAQIAYDNRAGNAATTQAARATGGRLVAYAVANPWRGAAALDELAWAHEQGARALAVDSALQGFDLLDGLVDPLVRFAAEHRWPVYVRTGTPPGHLPLPTAALARRFPEVAFVMGRSGATDFWIDAAPALRHAPNLYGDTSYAPWDTVLGEFARDPEIGTSRLVFSSDQPYATAVGEMRRMRDWLLPAHERAAVLGTTMAGLLGLEKEPPA